MGRVMPQYEIEQRVAESVARQAGQKLIHAVAAQTDFVVSMKGQNDFVTSLDTAVEDLVKNELAAAFPEDALFGEERGAEGHSASGRTWYIDPIDGTTNFVRGIPIYCVSIALRDGDDWVVGAVYDPNRDELFSGRLGGEVRLNNRAIRVAQTGALADAVVATGFPPIKKRTDQDNIATFTRVISVTRAVRRLGSAALDLAYVACGRLDGFWEFHLNPWDTGAAAFLVELAGGRVTTVDGGIHTGFEKSIVATNGTVHDELVRALKDS